VTYLAYFYTDIYGLKPEDASIIALIVGLLPVSDSIRWSALWQTEHEPNGEIPSLDFIFCRSVGAAALFAFSTPNFSYQEKWFMQQQHNFITPVQLIIYIALSGVITGDMGERNSISLIRFVR
jgi:Na+/melibiose symporter-like transporter